MLRVRTCDHRAALAGNAPWLRSGSSHKRARVIMSTVLPPPQVLAAVAVLLLSCGRHGSAQEPKEVSQPNSGLGNHFA